MPERQHILIVGNSQTTHVGANFLAAARTLDIPAEILDVNRAWTGGLWRRRVHHHLLGKLPTNLSGFSHDLVERCRRLNPTLILTTGICPVSASALKDLKNLGIRRVNYLTDDPWNPKNGARFFFDALPTYDTIYSPRHANMDDLRSQGCRDVRYLPFAYNPELHFREQPSFSAERERFACDVAFVGACDDDRVGLARALIRSGLKVHLYGGFWDRIRDLKPHHQGFAIGRDMRLAVSCGLVNLCMGRAANRDGHAMRSFELPAMGACLVVEDTAEHRALFGEDGQSVLYYRSEADAVERTFELCRQPTRRAALSDAAYTRICNGQHTYAARLQQILDESVTQAGAAGWTPPSLLPSSPAS